MISQPADNYLRAAHYLLYLLSLNGRAGQVTRETNYLWVTIVCECFMPGAFVYLFSIMNYYQGVYTWCLRAAKAETRLRGCAGLSEPLEIAYALCTFLRVAT